MKKYIGILVGILTFSSCSQKTEAPAAIEKSENITISKIENSITLTDAQQKNIEIEVVNLEQGTIPITMRLSARTTTTPQDKISVTSMLGGFVNSISVLPGNKVKKGQTIAVLEDPAFVQLQEDYLTTKTLITKANSDYNRQKELNESQAASTKVLEEAKAELSLLQIKKRALEEKLKLININPANVNLTNIRRNLAITAPSSGIVNAVFVNRGQYVSSSEALLEIIQTDTPMLSIKAFENDLPFLKVGQELEAFSNAKTNEKITAKIVAIPQSINPDGSIDILAKITNSNNIYTANMYFNVELITETNSANVLPKDALVHHNGQDFIIEEKAPNNYESIAVKVGNTTNEKIQIISEIDQNKKYVGKGAYAILMALKNSPEEE